jgi:hypothetical protein
MLSIALQCSLLLYKAPRVLCNALYLEGRAVAVGCLLCAGFHRVHVGERELLGRRACTPPSRVSNVNKD